MVKFSEETCNCIIKNYSEGLPLKYCADAAGVNRNTVYNWMNKGKKAKSGKYKKFYQDMMVAKSKFISHHLHKIHDSKSWMASQYLLQVTDTEQFVVAEKKQLEATVESESKTEIKLDNRTIFDKVDEELGLDKDATG